MFMTYSTFFWKRSVSKSIIINYTNVNAVQERLVALHGLVLKYNYLYNTNLYNFISPFILHPVAYLSPRTRCFLCASLPPLQKKLL